MIRFAQEVCKFHIQMAIEFIFGHKEIDRRSELRVWFPYLSVLSLEESVSVWVPHNPLGGAMIDKYGHTLVDLLSRLCRSLRLPVHVITQPDLTVFGTELTSGSVRYRVLVSDMHCI